MGLRGRLILSFVLIVILCITIIAVSLSTQISGMMERLAEVRLADISSPLFAQTRFLLRGSNTFDQVWQNMQEQADAMGITIFLCDRDGNVIRQTSQTDSICFPPAELLSRRTMGMGRSMSGKFIGNDNRVYLYRVFSVSGISKIREIGADWMVITTTTTGTLGILSELARPLLIAGILALVLSVIIALFLARSIYAPIKQLTTATSEIAAGKYDQQVSVSGPVELKALAANFNNMTLRIKESQQTLRDFVADVSHELRTPLTSIIGFAQAIRDGIAESREAVIKAARIIEDESRRLTRLVNNLLDLSKLESGQLEMKKETVDLNGLIAQCREIFSLRAEEKEISLIMDVEPLSYVEGDIDRLEQVLANLLDNAIKFTPQGGSITIKTRQVSPDRVEMSVTDTGPGLKKEQLSNLFKRFYREGSNLSGTGLGLAISRQIVQAHGGELFADSEVGKGSQFVIRIPCIQSKEANKTN